MFTSKITQKILDQHIIKISKIKKINKMSTLQSVLMPKNKFNKKEANVWIKKNNYINKKVDETKNYYRYRQVPPPKDKVKYYFVNLPNGVKFVMFSR